MKLFLSKEQRLRKANSKHMHFCTVFIKLSTNVTCYTNTRCNNKFNLTIIYRYLIMNMRVRQYVTYETTNTDTY